MREVREKDRADQRGIEKEGNGHARTVDDDEVRRTVYCLRKRSRSGGMARKWEENSGEID